MTRRSASVLITAALTGASGAGHASHLADVPGRWLLHHGGRVSCVLSFSGAPDIPHGTVAAMGFCPEMFLGLPRWRLDAGRVAISNRHGRKLADLVVGRGSLNGQTASGEAIFLER